MNPALTKRIDLPYLEKLRGTIISEWRTWLAALLFPFKVYVVLFAWSIIFLTNWNLREQANEANYFENQQMTRLTDSYPYNTHAATLTPVYGTNYHYWEHERLYVVAWPVILGYVWSSIVLMIGGLVQLWKCSRCAALWSASFSLTALAISLIIYYTQPDLKGVIRDSFRSLLQVLQFHRKVATKLIDSKFTIMSRPKRKNKKSQKKKTPMLVFVGSKTQKIKVPASVSPHLIEGTRFSNACSTVEHLTESLNRFLKAVARPV